MQQKLNRFLVMAAVSSAGLVRRWRAARNKARSFPVRYLVFSLVSLFVGLCYAIGTVQSWKILKKST